ncbi:hypothetical protein UY3_06087 [Chelonia mydas]|uniref:Uncharacterized protein n=1 Tax=Chelonia mydas TaxID=8469 RepID=M7C7Y3_CHEMY|nr:hypothetical protein UY3_06087 [Chelonia mydas]
MAGAAGGVEQFTGRVEQFTGQLEQLGGQLVEWSSLQNGWSGSQDGWWSRAIRGTADGAERSGAPWTGGAVGFGPCKVPRNPPISTQVERFNDLSEQQCLDQNDFLSLTDANNRLGRHKLTYVDLIMSVSTLQTSSQRRKAMSALQSYVGFIRNRSWRIEQCDATQAAMLEAMERSNLQLLATVTHHLDMVERHFWAQETSTDWLDRIVMQL